MKGSEREENLEQPITCLKLKLGLRGEIMSLKNKSVEERKTDTMAYIIELLEKILEALNK